MNRVLDNTQKMLDKQKWVESEKQGVDMSGCMPYCIYCGKREIGCGYSSCRTTQEDREKRRQETLRKMRIYRLHASEVDMLEEAGEL